MLRPLTNGRHGQHLSPDFVQKFTNFVTHRHVFDKVAQLNGVLNGQRFLLLHLLGHRHHFLRAGLLRQVFFEEQLELFVHPLVNACAGFRVLFNHLHDAFDFHLKRRAAQATGIKTQHARPHVVDQLPRRVIKLGKKFGGFQRHAQHRHLQAGKPDPNAARYPVFFKDGLKHQGHQLDHRLFTFRARFAFKLCRLLPHLAGNALDHHRSGPLQHRTGLAVIHVAKHRLLCNGRHQRSRWHAIHPASWASTYASASITIRAGHARLHRHPAHGGAASWIKTATTGLTSSRRDSPPRRLGYPDQKAADLINQALGACALPIGACSRCWAIAPGHLPWHARCAIHAAWSTPPQTGLLQATPATGRRLLVGFTNLEVHRIIMHRWHEAGVPRVGSEFNHGQHALLDQHGIAHCIGGFQGFKQLPAHRLVDQGPGIRQHATGSPLLDQGQKQGLRVHNVVGVELAPAVGGTQAGTQVIDFSGRRFHQAQCQPRCHNFVFDDFVAHQFKRGSQRQVGLSGGGGGRQHPLPSLEHTIQPEVLILLVGHPGVAPKLLLARGSGLIHGCQQPLLHHMEQRAHRL